MKAVIDVPNIKNKFIRWSIGFVSLTALLLPLFLFMALFVHPLTEFRRAFYNMSIWRLIKEDINTISYLVLSIIKGNQR